mmetsp:Transcript_18799/g.46816  ORF Transcript_18799/g.46816 Transcript_18799/m.46816 type:complete len:741 (-) Transcript_18799:73-2295(-)
MPLSPTPAARAPPGGIVFDVTTTFHLQRLEKVTDRWRAKAAATAVGGAYNERAGGGDALDQLGTETVGRAFAQPVYVRPPPADGGAPGRCSERAPSLSSMKRASADGEGSRGAAAAPAPTPSLFEGLKLSGGGALFARLDVLPAPTRPMPPPSAGAQLAALPSAQPPVSAATGGEATARTPTAGLGGDARTQGTRAGEAARPLGQSGPAVGPGLFSTVAIGQSAIGRQGTAELKFGPGLFAGLERNRADGASLGEGAVLAAPVSAEGESALRESPGEGKSPGEGGEFGRVREGLAVAVMATFRESSGASRGQAPSQSKQGVADTVRSDSQLTSDGSGLGRGLVRGLDGGLGGAAGPMSAPLFAGLSLAASVPEAVNAPGLSKVHGLFSTPGLSDTSRLSDTSGLSDTFRLSDISGLSDTFGPCNALFADLRLVGESASATRLTGQSTAASALFNGLSLAGTCLVGESASTPRLTGQTKEAALFDGLALAEATGAGFLSSTGVGFLSDDANPLAFPAESPKVPGLRPDSLVGPRAPPGPPEQPEGGQGLQWMANASEFELLAVHYSSRHEADADGFADCGFGDGFADGYGQGRGSESEVDPADSATAAALASRARSYRSRQREVELLEADADVIGKQASSLSDRRRALFNELGRAQMAAAAADLKVESCVARKREAVLARRFKEAAAAAKEEQISHEATKGPRDALAAAVLMHCEADRAVREVEAHQAALLERIAAAAVMR